MFAASPGAARGPPGAGCSERRGPGPVPIEFPEVLPRRRGGPRRARPHGTRWPGWPDGDPWHTPSGPAFNLKGC
eukprot:11533-Hanusia_phi.AAC.1